MHMSALVVGENVEEIMAPFDEGNNLTALDEEGYPYNPEGRWDWWVIGGRWESQPLIRYDGSTGLTVRRDELDLEAMSAAYFTPWGPYSLVLPDEWYSKHPLIRTFDPQAPWRERIAKYEAAAEYMEAMWPRLWVYLLSEVPDETPLTLVDYHV